MLKALGSALLAVLSIVMLVNAAEARSWNMGFAYGGFASKYNEERRIEEERRRAFLEDVAARKAHRQSAAQATSRKQAGTNNVAVRVAEPTRMKAAQTKVVGSPKSTPVAPEAGRSIPVAAAPQTELSVAQATEPISTAVVETQVQPTPPPPAVSSSTFAERTCRRFVSAVGIMVDGPCDE